MIREQPIELASGRWLVRMHESGRCEICDQNGDRIHASNGHESTAIHLAMALEDNRRLDKVARMLSERLGE